MIIRKAFPEELKRTEELFAIAFEVGKDLSKEETEEPERPMDCWAAFMDDSMEEKHSAVNKQTMMCYFYALHYSVFFDGSIYQMAGISGVASLPQYRRQGGIRGCFENALPDMYRNGFTFSYLYPFSTAYYRKFGYEMGCERFRYRIRLNMLRHFPLSGSCSLAEPGNLMAEEIKQISRVWQQKYNMMIQNTAFEYQWIEKSNPVKEQEFTYVYFSEQKEPKGYMTFKQINEESGRNLFCNRLCFTDGEGLKGLLNLAASLGSDHAYFVFELPADVDITLLIPEWSMGGGNCERSFYGMVRVVNVEKVLSGARYRGSGAIILRITDRQIPENNTTFSLEFRDGRATGVSRTEAYPDLTMGINIFSRLMIGACDTAAMEYMEGISIHKQNPAIEQVFYRKNAFITEYF